MSSTEHRSELDSLRLQVADLARQLAERDHTIEAQTQRLAETLRGLQTESRLLRTIIEGTAADTGEQFFASLVRHLTASLHVQYALIGEVVGEQEQRLRTVAVSAGGTLIDNFEYALRHAPCGTGLQQPFWCFTEGVQRRFPHCSDLTALGVESQCGVSLRSKEGAIIGLLIVMDTKPLRNAESLQSLLEVCASRAVAELERHRAEGVLAEQERHLLTAQALAHVGSWDWQLDSGAVTWSDEHYRIFGYTPGSVHITGDTLLTALHPDDRDKVLASVNDALHGHHPFDLEYRIVRRNGEVRWIHGRAEVHRQATGGPLRMDGTVLDITAQKQAEEALRASEERWQLAVRGSNDGIWDWDIQTGEVFFSTRWKAMRGYEEQELSDSLDEWRSRIHPDDKERVLAAADAYLARQRPDFCEEYRVQRKDGSYMWILDRGAAIWDGRGTALRMAGSETDITERKQAEEALRESEARTRSIIDTALDAVITIDRDSRILGWNSQATSIFGYAAHEAIGRNLSDTIIPLRFRAAHAAGLARVFQSDEGTPEKRRMEFSSLHRDGHEFPIEFAIAMTYIGGQPVFSAFVRDITEQKRAAESLAQREGQLRTVLEALPVGVWFTDAQGRVLLSNPAARELWAGVQHIGIGAGPGSDRSNWWETTGPAAEPHRWMLSDVLTKGVPATDDMLEIACQDGTRKIVRNSAAPVRADDGSIQGAILMNEDITARVHAERERERAQEFLESIIENIPHMITVKDTQDLRFVTVNRAAEQFFERSRTDLIGSSVFDILDRTEASLISGSDAEVLARNSSLEIIEHVVNSRSLGPRVLRTKKLPIFASEGRPQHLLSISEDVTDAKQAEEALREREQDLRRAMEERERISQDLHDGILQSLYAVGLGLESCKPLINEHRHDQALETMGTAIRQLNHIMAEVRNFIAGLESEVLQGGNFEAAVRTVINTVTESYPLDCRVRIERAALVHVPTDRGLQVLNILREALSNSVRHAKASQISVSVRRLRRTIRLRIQDNGIGFDLKTVTGTGHGLLNMAARAKKIGAGFDLHPAPGRGTTITLDLPKEDVGVHG